MKGTLQHLYSDKEIKKLLSGAHVTKLKKANYLDRSGIGRKKCLFTIKGSAINENIKKDYDSCDYKSLRVKTIVDSFPSLFQSKLLDLSALLYVMKRIGDNAHEKGLIPLFYLDHKGSSFNNEPDEYFFIDKDIFPSVKKMMKSDPVVKLKRICETNKKQLKKVVSSVKNDFGYKKVDKKNKEQRQSKLKQKTNVESSAKKRLKVNHNKYVYVDKNSYKLAKKAVTPCYVKLPILNKLENVGETVTVKMSEASPCSNVGIGKDIKRMKEEIQKKIESVELKKMENSQKRSNLLKEGESHQLDAQDRSPENVNQNKDFPKESFQNFDKQNSSEDKLEKFILNCEPVESCANFNPENNSSVLHDSDSVANFNKEKINEYLLSIKQKLLLKSKHL